MALHLISADSAAAGQAGGKQTSIVSSVKAVATAVARGLSHVFGSECPSIQRQEQAGKVDSNKVLYKQATCSIVKCLGSFELLLICVCDTEQRT
jgi:hypothetical protein